MLIDGQDLPWGIDPAVSSASIERCRASVIDLLDDPSGRKPDKGRDPVTTVLPVAT
jgi:hypothetical protein